MSRITNRAGLPQSIVNAVTRDPYTRGASDFSTTMLAKPSRIVALEKLHADEIEEEAADRLYALLGQLGHLLLERSGTADIIEKRLFTEIDGKILSGQVDIVDGTILSDYKFCSLWTAKEGVKPEWVSQASVNRLLCHRNDIQITKAEYIAMFRDFSKVKSVKDPEHPKSPVQVFNVPMWPLDETEAWIKERMASHENAMQELPECTPDERWSRGAKLALIKKGRKTAVRLFDDLKEAERWSKENGIPGGYGEEFKPHGDYSLESRTGEEIRCEYYCPCVRFCSQAKALGVKAARQSV